MANMSAAVSLVGILFLAVVFSNVCGSNIGRDTNKGSLPPMSSLNQTEMNVSYSAVSKGEQFSINSTSSATIDENVNVNTTVTTVTTDAAEENITVTFSLVTQDPALPVTFQIDTNTGVLQNTAALDHEKVAVYTLLIRAANNANTSDIAEQNLTININDVNEKPVFENQVFEATFMKEKMAGDELLMLKATDPENNTITYIKVDKENVTEAFVINMSTGMITVASNKTLEVPETGSTVYMFNVTATDNGSPTRAAMAAVKITMTMATNDSGVITGKAVAVVHALVFIVYMYL